MNVIEVKGLGKKYRIGKADKQADTLTGALINGLLSPWQNLRNIRNLSRLDRDEDSVAWALRDVSFEVKEGEVLGIIGHNGAGKSTLLKILSRITEPSEGEVRIQGRVAALLEVGTGFHPELTGRENIYMNGTILGMRKKEIDRKLDEIVDFSGVEKYLDTPVKFYSSGMRVRLGFSVAAHLEPEILIIDEVLAVGDAEFQRKCMGQIANISGRGKTVLFVSHDLVAIQNLTNRCLLLEKGEISMDSFSDMTIKRYREGNKTQNIENSFVLSPQIKKIKSSHFETTKLVLLSGLNNSNKFLVGKELVFDIYFESFNEYYISLDLAIVLKSREFQPVVCFNTKFKNAPIRVNRNDHQIRCIVEQLNLTPGEYIIHLWVSVNGSTQELIENAGSLEIVENDIFNSGVLPNSRFHGHMIHKNFDFIKISN